MRNHAQYCRLPHRIRTCKFFSAEICIHIPIFPHYISPRILNMTTHILDQKPVSTVQHTFIVSKGVLYYLLDQFQLLAISIALNLACRIIYCWHHLKNCVFNSSQHLFHNIVASSVGNLIKWGFEYRIHKYKSKRDCTKHFEYCIWHLHHFADFWGLIMEVSLAKCEILHTINFLITKFIFFPTVWYNYSP